MSKGRFNPPHEDRRANPHLEEYDPRYVTPSPQPHYQQFPQPHYPPADRGDKYQTKPWDYRNDDRYFRMSDQQYQQEQQRMREREQLLQMEEQQRRGHHLPGPQYGPSSFRPDERLHYDVLPPAGRANKYNVRITDLLTSVKEPQMRDEPLNKMMEENKGYLVLIRLRRDDLGELIKAIQMTLSTISADHGYVIGFSDNKGQLWQGQKMMEVLVSNFQPNAGQQWWNPHDSQSSQFAVCCLWFKDFTSAMTWFETAPKIKSKDFPDHNPFQAIAVPLTFGGNSEPLPFSPALEEITLLWCEYPKIYERWEEDFLQNYSEPARQRIKYHFGTPNVSVSKYKPYWPEGSNRFSQPTYNPISNQHDRVGRPLRNPWIEPDSFISVSTFPTMQQCKNFFYDEKYQEHLSRLHKYAAPVFVAITLSSIRGTRKK